MGPYTLSRLAEGFVGRQLAIVREPEYAKLREGETLEQFWRSEYSSNDRREWRTWKEWEAKK